MKHATHLHSMGDMHQMDPLSTRKITADTIPSTNGQAERQGETNTENVICKVLQILANSSMDQAVKIPVCMWSDVIVFQKKTMMTEARFIAIQIQWKFRPFCFHVYSMYFGLIK